MIVYNKSWKNFSIYLKVVGFTLWGFLVLSLKQYIIDGDIAPIVGLAGGGLVFLLHRKDNGIVSPDMQASMLDAVLGPDKGGIIIDDKPFSRDVKSKDFQEMGRNIEAYTMKYAVPPKEIRIEWYNPVTGKNEGYTPFPISKFIRERKK